MRIRVLVLAATLILAPLGAKAADLVVWWEKGFYPQEDETVGEVIAAFEQKTGKQVDLTHYSNSELPDKLEAALEAGQPPDFAFGLTYVSSKWAFDDRLVDLTDTVGAFSNLFDPEALAWSFQLNGNTGQRTLYGLPMGRSTIHLHVWKNLMEQAGFTPADIPQGWDAFWSFWCDEVQPEVRRALGRDDIYGIGLNMSDKATEVSLHFLQFLDAYDAEYVTSDGKLVTDDPRVRQGIVKAIDSYTAIYRKAALPPVRPAGTPIATTTNSSWPARSSW